MAGFRVQVTGVDAIIRGLERANPGLNRKITTDALVESALLVTRAGAQRHIRRGGGGPPRPNILTSRTGALRRSYSQQGSSLDKSGLPNKIAAGSNLVYSRIHELGGRAGRGRLSRIPKRPVLAPALAEESPNFPRIFEKHWARALP